MATQVNAVLVKQRAISEKTNREYTYVGVYVDGEEITRLFLRPLELRALFPND